MSSVPKREIFSSGKQGRPQEQRGYFQGLPFAAGRKKIRYWRGDESISGSKAK